MSGTSRESLAKFIYCCSFFEEKVARAYGHMAELMKNDAVACLLAFIARDSFKHADCLRRIGEILSAGVKADYDECEEVLGKIWRSAVMEVEAILDRKEIRSEDLASIIRGLERIEGFAAEEYLMVLQIKLFELMAKDLKVDIGCLKALLEWIIEDERRHESILKMIGRSL